jgi:beta-N-acetylhexosaminidase
MTRFLHIGTRIPSRVFYTLAGFTIACAAPQPVSGPAPAAGGGAAQAVVPPVALGDTAPARVLADTMRGLRGPFQLTRSFNDDERRWVDSVLAGLSLRQRVGQMVWIWVLGDYTSTDDSSFARVRRDIIEHGIGGVTMSLGTPMEVATKLNTLQRLARVPLIASSDLEPGLGRLEGGLFSHYLLDAGSATVMPQAMAIAATGNDEDAYTVGRVIGREARATGIHINFAPTIDVNNNPANPVINVRSFGEDPERVARLAVQFIRGSENAGVLATAKHFPGHGDTDVDSHVGLPVVGSNRARLDSVELVPFRAAIRAGVPLVMTAHIALPAIVDRETPATLAPGIIHDLLRDTLGFGGLTVTDALTMEGVGKGYSVEESAVQAVRAGSDVLLMPRDTRRAIDAVVAAVERGELTEQRITQAARRILELKVRTGAAGQPLVDLEAMRTVVGSADHRARAEDIARRAITLLRDQQNLIPVPATGRVVVIQYMPETELKAGRQMQAEIQRAVRGARVFKITPRSGRAELDSIGRVAAGADRVIVAAYVRRVEGEGRTSIPAHIASWIDALAARERLVMISLGNPYLIRQFPRVRSYMVTFGVGDALERAAARAVLGASPITGRSPVGLPGFFSRGDGIAR